MSRNRSLTELKNIGKTIAGRLNEVRWRIGKAISGGYVSAFSVGPFCRKGFSDLPQDEPKAECRMA